ncbi:Inner membrane protein YcfT [Micromonospora sp. MW-13]|uniref:acyltransferase family protein n=1 Tax=Micromonospora sp. MW-13 TaxID=2094022 RepID=UPI000E433D19|nr:acyltransferase family protein [Micromonospora sp. MW-13]RGC68611.1 Inner membrane protein YcfT [Micromonospora sp. MW-13]
MTLVRLRDRAYGVLSGSGRGRPHRAEWADAVKGVCIVLIVSWHVTVKPGLWGALGEQLLPLRMPLFFIISGVFAASALQRPWWDVGRSRTARFLCLYAISLLIHTAILAAAFGFPTDRVASARGLLERLTVTTSKLWYLYALALYVAFAKAVRRAPRALVLVPAAALYVVTTAGLLDTPGNRGGLYQNLAVYVIHMTVLALLHRLLVAPISGLGGVGQALVMLGYPILLTGLVIGVSLAVNRRLTALGARWLFGLRGRRRSEPAR